MSSVEDENSNTSDSSSDEEDVEKELLSRASELEAGLSTNKYHYDLHVEVINIYRKLTDLNSLREAYQRFHEYFPLTPKLWLEWIRDEIKIANTKDEQQKILELFEKAVDDYLSVDVWIEYAQYSIGVSDIKTTRAILEKGLTSAGLHVGQGSLLWDTLREVENAHISLHQKDSEQWVNQVKRVADVFKRQLSIPLLNMENTYLEWLDWSKTLPDGLVDQKQIEWGYKKALQTLEIYKPFEDKLSSAEERELYDIYKEYIKIVKDPSTVLCLYERAVVILCLSPYIWGDYIKFSFKMEEVALKVTKKALRNCSWSEDLWIARLRILEKYNVDEKEVVTCFEQGLSNINPSPPLDFWFCFLEYYHRTSKDKTKLDKLFEKALEQIHPEHDPTYKLSRWYARLVAKRGDIAEARKIWNEIMTDPNIKGSANAWLEFTNFERQYGEPNQVRNIFKRGLSSCKDWAQYIGEEWLIFEREVGSLEDVMKCSERCNNLVKNISPQYSQTKMDSYKDNSEKPIRSQKRKYEKEEDFNFKKLKVSQDREVIKNKVPSPSTTKIIEKDPKTTVFVSNLHPNVTEQDLKDLFPNALNISIVLDRKGKSRCFGYLQFSKEEETMTALARDRIPIDGRPVFISELKSDKGDKKKDFKYPTTTEDNKLFVKNLPLTKSKEEVEEIFKLYNPIDVRLIFKKNGQSKGIAYIEFKTKQEAQKALELNSKKIDDCELFVAISAPPQKKIVDTLEQNEPIRHARSRLQVPMIPRTLQVKNNPEKLKSNGSADSSNKESKSNADFRNMFLKK